MRNTTYDKCVTACRDHASSQSDPGVGRNRFNHQRLFLSESTPRCSASSHSTVDASVRPSRTAPGRSSTREPMARKRVSSSPHAGRREHASRFAPIDQWKQVGFLCPGTSARQAIRQGRTRWDLRLTGARCGSQMGVRGTQSGVRMSQGVQINSVPMPGPASRAYALPHRGAVLIFAQDTIRPRARPDALVASIADRDLPVPAARLGGSQRQSLPFRRIP